MNRPKKANSTIPSSPHLHPLKVWNSLLIHAYAAKAYCHGMAIDL
jgi:hypothetical protein